MSGFAPIVLFVYNRPVHTRQTLEALSENPGAKESTLYVFCDGPKPGATPGELEAIAEVRRIVSERNWSGTVEIENAASNRGLAASIVEGVTTIVRKHGMVIVLEDDIILAPGALNYFNRALTMYENEQRVFQISGFTVRNRPWARSTGFLRMSTSWGWATWDRAWQHYQGDAAALSQQVEVRGETAFDLDGFSFHFEELCRNARGELKTWAVKWYASIYLLNGLCLYPRRSLVRNAGFDGSGENCENDASGYFGRLPLARRIRLDKIPLAEDRGYLRAMQRSFAYRLKVWTGARFRDRVARRFRAIAGRIKKG